MKLKIYSVSVTVLMALTVAYGVAITLMYQFSEADADFWHSAAITAHAISQIGCSR